MQKTINFNNNSDQKQWSNVNSKPQPAKYKFIFILIGFLILITIILLIYIFKLIDEKNLLSTDLAGQQAQIQAEASRYMDQLRNILLIDTEESPIIAKVVDPDKLRVTNSEFYKNVQKDDIVFVFSYRIIILRESEQKIINIAPIVNVATTISSTTSSSKSK